MTLISLPPCIYKYIYIYIYIGRRVNGISGSLIWSKTLMELIFNSCGEFRWSPSGPVSQIHSPRLLIDAPGIFSDLLRFVQMLKREWGAKSKGSCRTYSSLIKLQPRFLGLQWKTCLWAEHWWWCIYKYKYCMNCIYTVVIILDIFNYIFIISKIRANTAKLMLYSEYVQQTYHKMSW